MRTEAEAVLTSSRAMGVSMTFSIEGKDERIEVITETYTLKMTLEREAKG